MKKILFVPFIAVSLFGGGCNYNTCATAADPDACCAELIRCPQSAPTPAYINGACVCL